MKPSRPQIIFVFLSFFLFSGVPAWCGQGEEELSDLGFLTMEEPATPARSPRPASRIAENVTVITADQIEALNAHTLAEVLNTVPGIQFDQMRTPGSWAFFNIQGAVSRHIQVLIDGVPQNDLTENAPDLGLMSVQHVERIEIIKGAASAAWGQALGGVVNIVTKSPEADKPFSGGVLSSYGERATSDFRGEMTGSINRLGYYLSGGNLHSDGLLPDNNINRNNAYGKISYDFQSRGYLTAGFDYRGAKRGLFSTAVYDLKESDSASYGYSFLNFVFPFHNRLKLDLLVRESRKKHDISVRTYTDEPLGNTYFKERTKGGSAKLIWGDTWRNMVMGIDYEHADASKVGAGRLSDLDARVMNRWGIYSNGAVTVGDFTILPGIRFDDTGIQSSLVSYTLGATYQLTDKTVLRCYGAKGYSLPSAFAVTPPEQVWTVQAGAESSQVPYLWLKGTFFYNSIWDIYDPNPKTGLKKAEKQGVEIELRTVPIYYLSFTAGYTFTDARNSETNQRIDNVPAHSAKLSLQYDNSSMGLRGVLAGNLVRWNTSPEAQAKDAAVLWDLSLTKRFPIKDYAPELFFTVHNLFNDAQYQVYVFRNTGRWVEGGVRFRF